MTIFLMGVPFCITTSARHSVSCKRNFIGFYWRLDKNCSVILERFILVPAEFKIPKAAVKLHKIISFHLHFFEKVKRREIIASLSLSHCLYRVVNAIQLTALYWVSFIAYKCFIIRNNFL